MLQDMVVRHEPTIEDHSNHESQGNEADTRNQTGGLGKWPTVRTIVTYTW
jgi:hypothetical protein